MKAHLESRHALWQQRILERVARHASLRERILNTLIDAATAADAEPAKERASAPQARREH